MKKIAYIFIAAFIFLEISPISARTRIKKDRLEKSERLNNFRSNLGFKAGASFGFPAGAIPKGASGMPLPAPTLGMYYNLHFKNNSRWSVMTGLETYALKANFSAPYSQFEYVGNIAKYIYGDNQSDRIDSVFIDKAFVEGGRFNNRYLSVPIMAQYSFRKGWSLVFGGYVSHILRREMTGTAKDIYFGDRTNPNYSIKVNGEMPFEESNKIKKWDFGLNVGGNYELKSGINFDLRVNAGLTDFFVKEFTAPPSAYHTIVVQTTIGYRIGGGRKI